MTLRYAYVLNPAAKGGRAARLWPGVAAQLDAAGIGGPLHVSSAPGDGERLVRLAAATADVVVVAGGDGTVHEAVNGLVGTDAALGVLPLGTGNDFALALGMPRAVGEAVACLAATLPRAVDVGVVRWHVTEDGQDVWRERRFANAVGVGFDALAALGVAQTKWLGGRAAYLAAVLRALRAVRHPTVCATLAVDGAVVLDGPLFLCEVGNGHSVGGGFLLTPDARLDDGRFGVCIVRHLPTLRALRLLPTVFSGGHIGYPEVTMAEGVDVRVEAETHVLAVHADGEGLTLAARAVHATIRPGGLRAVAPGRKDP